MSLVTLLKAVAKGVTPTDDVLLDALADSARVAGAKSAQDVMPKIRQLKAIAAKEGLPDDAAKAALNVLRERTTPLSGAGRSGMRGNLVQTPRKSPIDVDPQSEFVTGQSAVRRQKGEAADDLDSMLDDMESEDDLVGMFDEGTLGESAPRTVNQREIKAGSQAQRVNKRGQVTKLAAEPGDMGASTYADVASFLPPDAPESAAQNILSRVRPVRAATERGTPGRGVVVARYEDTTGDVSFLPRGRVADQQTGIQLSRVATPDGIKFAVTRDAKSGGTPSLGRVQMPVDVSTGRPITIREAEGGRGLSREGGEALFDTREEAEAYLNRARRDATQWRTEEAMLTGRGLPDRERARQTGGTTTSRLTESEIHDAMRSSDAQTEAAELLNEFAAPKRQNFDVAREAGEAVAPSNAVVDLPDAATLARQGGIPLADAQKRLDALASMEASPFRPVEDRRLAEQLLRIGAGAPGMEGRARFANKDVVVSPLRKDVPAASRGTGVGGRVAPPPTGERIDTSAASEPVSFLPRGFQQTDMMQELRRLGLREGINPQPEYPGFLPTQPRIAPEQQLILPQARRLL